QARVSDILGEPSADGPSLNTREGYCRVLQSPLGRESLSDVMVPGGKGLRLGCLCCRAVSPQVPGADELGPRAARIGRQPEPVRAENDMIPQDHASSPVW